MLKLVEEVAQDIQLAVNCSKNVEIVRDFFDVKDPEIDMMISELSIVREEDEQEISQFLIEKYFDLLGKTKYLKGVKVF